MATGGSIEEVTIDGRAYTVPADNEANLFLGGATNETPANGNFTSRLIKTAASWKIEGLQLVIDHSAGDFEAIQVVADRKDFVDISITLADDSVYNGRGQVTGDATGSTQSATAAVTLMGTGPLTLA